MSRERPITCRRNGRFTGFPVLGVKWQRMESAGLRQAYGLVPPRKGVLVRSIWPTSPVSKEVRPDDIIMRFDGVDIACDGTVPFRRACTPCAVAAHSARNKAPLTAVPFPLLPGHLQSYGCLVLRPWMHLLQAFGGRTWWMAHKAVALQLCDWQGNNPYLAAGGGSG